MRVCVIGTSNAIYAEGYTAGIRDHRRVTRFEKHALGASPSAIIPYFVAKVDLSQFDWVVFETTINDQNYLKYGSIRKSQIREFVEWGAARAAAQGCRTALVVMPTVPGLKGETIPRLIYRKVAAESGALFFDAFDHLSDIRSSDFIDRFHIKKPIAKNIGLKLAELLYDARGTCLPVVTPRSHFYCRSLAQSTTSLRLISRETSIATADLAVFENPEPIHAEAGPWDELAAVVYNAARSAATLRFGSDPSVTKSLRTTYAFGDKPLTMIVAPVTGRPRAGRNPNGFCVRLATQGSGTDEVSRFDHLPDLGADLPYRAEVSDLIFRRKLRLSNSST